MRAELITPLVLGALAGPLFTLGGQEPRDCSDPRDQHEETRCAERALADANRRLDRLLADISRTRGSAAAAKLRTVQRTWGRYRDAHCAWEAGTDWADGSMHGQAVAGCKSRLTKERFDMLREWLCSSAERCPAWLRNEPAQPRGARRR